MAEVEMKETGVCRLFQYFDFHYNLFSASLYLSLYFYSIIQFFDWWPATT